MQSLFGHQIPIVEAPSKEAVMDLMKTDPFYTCGRVEVLHWSKALERKVLV